MTPVELFSPFLACAVAKRVLEFAPSPPSELVIIEFGSDRKNSLQIY